MSATPPEILVRLVPLLSRTDLNLLRKDGCHEKRNVSRIYAGPVGAARRTRATWSLLLPILGTLSDRGVRRSRWKW
jgi:hypothetical protein